jgi:hypothetical protein
VTTVMHSNKPQMEEYASLRRGQIGRLSRFLAKYSQPRFQLFLILVLTAAVGAGTSFVLLKNGLDTMWLRYPIAAVIAYLTFLALLRLWVQCKLSQLDFSHEAYLDEPEPEPKSQRSTWNTGLFDLLDLVCWFDDFPVAILIVAVVIILVVVLGIIVAAPVLMAEVLVDGILVAGLWHRFMLYGKQSSLRGTIRATILPAIAVVVCLAIIGLILQMIEPGANSIGDVFRGGNSE